jgi:Mrp family chromosome partitioning ATPase
LEGRIREIREHLSTTILQDIELLRTQMEEVDAVLNTYPDDEIQLATLSRDVELNTELDTQLQTSLQEVRIREAEVGEEVSIVNYPTSAIPDQQSGRGLKTVVGIVLGLMLGIVMAFILETLDTSIGTIEDVEEYLEIPVLAVIPHLDVDKMSDRLVDDNPQLADDPNLGMYARLITQYDPRSPAAEAYRTLRTNLQFATAGAGEMMETKNTFVFTSSSLQEGKTTTLVNLAITVAQAGNRVLLMGCNLRRPTIYKSFGLPRERGMTDILTGQIEWRDCIKSVTDMMVGPLSLQEIMSMPGLDNLHIVTAGGIPPNPSELLNSPRFSQMIEEARNEYDLVLVDCPPILPVTDAAIVGRQVDWGVLVYQVGKVPRNALRRAKLHLSNVGAHVLGIAMNDVKAEISGYSPYSQYMIKYYGEEGEVQKTLFQRLRDRFSRKTEDREDKPEIKRTLLQRLLGKIRRAEKEEEAAWVEVDYREDIPEEEGGEEASKDDMEALPFSRVSDDESENKSASESGPSTPAFRVDEEHDIGTEEQTGKEPPGTWFSRVPLWQWIVLGALIVILILSFVFGFWSHDNTVTAAYATGEVRSSTDDADRPVSQGAMSRGDKVWSVLIGSFKTPAEAESFILARPTISNVASGSYWSRAEEVPNLGVWYRVFAGQYANRADCEIAAQTLRKSGKVSISMSQLIIAPTP